MADPDRTRIKFDPAVLAGKPTVRGLRISVEHVLRALSNGVPEAELLADYPDLEPDDLRACLAYAADLVAAERVFPVPGGGVNVLVDVSTGQAVADAIRGLGHDTLFVRDRDPSMPDADILAWAVAEQRLVVTMDKDFGELIYRSGQPHAGVLLLRLEAARTAEKVRVVTEILTNHGWALPGHFSVYQDGRLRIR